ncbi:hypothetical protein H2201_008598 [Coniosporium apollinis]|uniref:Rhodopsin domain-containing protein n=1 Tax=Coniosporium apollinis TaxID=61459 RepID=A0ABQ9NHR7_9PEZI|nr:hypothetical protein H2201_008598 [Coniosporium apollinis]
MSSAATPELTPEYLAEDARPGPRAGIIVVTTLSLLVVALRCYTRVALTPSGFGRDDLLMVITAVFNVVTMILFLLSMDYGIGIHTAAITPERFVIMFKLVVALQLVYHIGLCVCRVSGIALYARICQNVKSFQRYMLAAFIFVTLVCIAQTLLLALQCIPLKALWGDGPGKCMGSYTVFLSTASMTIICDTLVLLIPLRILWTLQINLRKKIALGFILLIGLFAVVTSVFRIVSMIPAVTRPDPTWYYADILVWSSTELSAAMIALSIPAIRPLFTCLGTSIKGSSARSRHYGYNETGGSWKGSHALKTFGSGNQSSHIRSGKRDEVDNISEENLCGDDGIMKTVDVRVRVRTEPLSPPTLSIWG